MGCLIQSPTVWAVAGNPFVLLLKFLFHDYKLSLLLYNIVCGFKMFGKYMVLIAKC